MLIVVLIAGFSFSGEFFLEAESGRLSGTASIATSELALSSGYVELGERGRVDFELKLEQQGTYYAWQRVITSFPIRIYLDDKSVGELPSVRPGEWVWVTQRQPIELSPGKHILSYRTGKGSSIDFVWLTRTKPVLGRLSGDRALRDVVSSAFSQHIDVTKFYGAREYAVAYFLTLCNSPEERDISIIGGCDDSIKIWVNDELVLRCFAEGRSSSHYQFSCKAELREGKNTILLKSENGHKGWDFYFLLVGSDGRLLGDLRYTNGLDSQASLFPRWSTLGIFPSGKDRSGFDKRYEPERLLDLRRRNWKPVKTQQPSPDVVSELTAKGEILSLPACPAFEEAKPVLPEIPKPKRTFYVSPEGSDLNDGSPDRPWRTLEKASSVLQLGDELIIEPGLYKGSVRPRASGKPDAWIHYTARSGAVLNGSILFDGLNVSYTKISGLKLVGRLPRPEELQEEALSEALQKFKPPEALERYPGKGISFLHRTSYVVIEDCEVTRFGIGISAVAGLMLFFRRIKVHHNNYGMHLGVKGPSGVHSALVEDCYFGFNNRPDHWNTDGLCAEGYCTNIVVLRCRSKGHGDSGFDLKPRDTIVDRCIAAHNKSSGFKLWGPGTVITNSIAFKNYDTGISIARPGIALINCTIAYNIRCALRPPKGEGIKDFVLRNCIIAFNGPIRHYGEGGMYIDEHSLYYVKPGEPLWCEMDEGITLRLNDIEPGRRRFSKDTIFADPQFVDESLKPKSTSPAIDAGMPATDHDFLGRPRPRGKAPDLGAFEYNP